jgi:hypothetical protein
LSLQLKVAKSCRTSKKRQLTCKSMIDYLEKDGRLTFKVRVVIRASRSEIVGERDGALRVRLAATPMDGAANEELIRTLAKALNIPRSAIEITSGHTSRLKQVRATGVHPRALEKWHSPKSVQLKL